MAIINVTINTDDQTIQANVNGTNLHSVYSVSAYIDDYNGEKHFSVSLGQATEIDGIETRTSMYFSKSPEAQEAACCGRSIACEHEGFIKVKEYDESNLVNDLSKLMGKE